MSKGLKFLEKLGLVEYEGSPGADSETPSASPAPTAAPVASPPPVAAAPTVVDSARFAEVDKACKARLTQAMENDGAPLPEEFMETLSVLETIPTEEARFKTALSLLGKRGHTPAAILSDYDKTLGVLEETARAFEGNLKVQIESKVGAKHASVEQLTSDIAAKQAQIQAMQAEIESLTVQRDNEQSSIAEEQSKLTTVQQRFKVIFAHVKNEIQGQRTKIAQYGGI
jgi:chromosome segregation ATPase